MMKLFDIRAKSQQNFKLLGKPLSSKHNTQNSASHNIPIQVTLEGHLSNKALVLQGSLAINNGWTLNCSVGETSAIVSNNGILKILYPTTRESDIIHSCHDDYYGSICEYGRLLNLMLISVNQAQVFLYEDGGCFEVTVTLKNQFRFKEVVRGYAKLFTFIYQWFFVIFLCLISRCQFTGYLLLYDSFIKNSMAQVAALLLIFFFFFIFQIGINQSCLLIVHHVECV